MAGSLTTSNFMMNVAWVLLLLNWVIEGDFKTKFAKVGRNPMLVAFLAFMAVHLLWLLVSDNWSYGLDDIRKKLPLLVVPLVMLTTKRPSPRHRRWVLMVYVASVLTVTVIGWVRYLTIPDLPYRNIVPYISHIRFALNVCLSIVILLYGGITLRLRARQPSCEYVLMRRSLWQTPLSVLLAGWLLVFLLLIQSYTALVILVVVVLALLIAYWREIYPKSVACLISLIIVLGGMTYLVVSYTQDYYHIDAQYDQTPHAKRTVNGNRYEHACDGFVENGNYVNNYVCTEELSEHWAKVSDMDLEALTPNGYAVKPTLIRYLNGIGATKDSVGIAKLTTTDIEAIEKGVANPVYLSRNKIRKMVYVMLFEYENYRCYHRVKDFTMLQRFELWRNCGEVFLRNPIIGTGTGDVVDECHANLARHGSELTGTTKHAHNQYLTLLTAFGLLGFACIIYFATKGLRACRRTVLWMTYGCIVIVSFITEDTLETLAGCLFVAFFGSFFAERKRVIKSHKGSSINSTLSDKLK